MEIRRIYQNKDINSYVNDCKANFLDCVQFNCIAGKRKVRLICKM